jgi:MYND finger
MCDVCDNDAMHECGRCGVSKYCGESCQSTHWVNDEHHKVCFDAKNPDPIIIGKLVEQIHDPEYMDRDPIEIVGWLQAIANLECCAECDNPTIVKECQRCHTVVYCSKHLGSEHDCFDAENPDVVQLNHLMNQDDAETMEWLQTNAPIGEIVEWLQFIGSESKSQIRGARARQERYQRMSEEGEAKGGIIGTVKKHYGKHKAGQAKGEKDTLKQKRRVKRAAKKAAKKEKKYAKKSAKSEKRAGKQKKYDEYRKGKNKESRNYKKSKRKRYKK